MKKVLSGIHIVLHVIWIFFPGILLLGAGCVALIFLEQGQDLMLTSVESVLAPGNSLVAITFWAFISWYTARWVSHAKLDKKYYHLKSVYRLHKYFPRALGMSCYIIFILAVFHLRFISISFIPALLIVVSAMLITGISGWIWIRNRTPIFEKWPFVTFLILVIVLYGLVTLLVGTISSMAGKLLVLTAGHFLTGLAFLNFTCFRRIYLKKKKENDTLFFNRTWKEWRTDFSIIFTLILIMGSVIYLVPVFSRAGAEYIGSLNFVITGFGIMLFIGNLIAFFSVKAEINLHLFVFAALFVIGQFADPYRVRTISVSSPRFADRISLQDYFEKWCDQHSRILNDTSSEKRLPVYISLADGGASRSGYWVAQVLGALEDSIRISRDLLCISGASGGTVGNVTYYNLLEHPDGKSFRTRAAEFLRHDFLTYTLTRILSPAYFLNDRGHALEEALEYADRSMSTPYSSYTLKQTGKMLPILYVNTTRMQDSHPALISNIRFNKRLLNNRLDVLHILDSLKSDIRLSSVAILSSRFPYISPAGGIGNEYFVDGGYFDNSGAGAAHETLLAFVSYLSEKYPALLKKIDFKVIHISNTGYTQKKLKKVNPIINDLATPLTVLAASYGQQTEINTLRLHKYLGGLESYTDSTGWYDINLYSPDDSIGYSMNWYMSDDCRHRIDRRLNRVLHNEIKDLIMDFRKYR